MWLLLVMLISKTAANESLFGKMFTFPQESTAAHVLVLTRPVNLTALSLCFRCFTDSQQQHTFFSLSMDSFTDDLLIHYEPETKAVVLQVGGAEVRFRGVDFPLNQWNSLCLTWEASSGIAHLSLNGWSLTRKYISESHLNGTPFVALGQRQSLSPQHAFVGMLNDVHMWDTVLTSCGIRRFIDGAKEQRFNYGNIINWRRLSYEIRGRVLVEDVPRCGLELGWQLGSQLG